MAAAASRSSAFLPHPPAHLPWIVAQEWYDVLFMHWRAPPDQMRAALPPQLAPSLDLYDDEAWASIVAFGVRRFRPRMLPPLPAISDFTQVNVRTYVRMQDRAGIYTFTLDVDNLLAVIGTRLLYNLPYRHASLHHTAQDGGYRFESQQMDAHGQEDALTVSSVALEDTPASGGLSAWLVERYTIFGVAHTGRIMRADVRHKPWTLTPAAVEITRNTLLPDALQVDGSTPDLAHHGSPQDVRIWPPTYPGKSA